MKEKFEEKGKKEPGQAKNLYGDEGMNREASMGEMEEGIETSSFVEDYLRRKEVGLINEDFFRSELENFFRMKNRVESIKIKE